MLSERFFRWAGAPGLVSALPGERGRGSSRERTELTDDGGRRFVVDAWTYSARPSCRRAPPGKAASRQRLTELPSLQRRCRLAQKLRLSETAGMLPRLRAGLRRLADEARG